MKFFKCLVRDSGDEEFSIIIQSTEECTDYDEEVFFYGLSKIEILRMIKRKELLDGEYLILEILRTERYIEDLL